MLDERKPLRRKHRGSFVPLVCRGDRKQCPRRLRHPPQWVADGMPDFVNQTDNTDQGADSTGCGMAFLSWMISQGHGLEKIAPAMVNLGDSGTLADLYAALTGDNAGNAWPKFQDAVKNLPGGIKNDDPFGGLSKPPQLANIRAAIVPAARAHAPAVCQPKSKRLLPPKK